MALPTGGVSQKLRYSAGFYINLCAIHFWDFLQSIGTPRRILLQEKSSEGPSVHSCGHEFWFEATNRIPGVPEKNATDLKNSNGNFFILIIKRSFY